MFRLHFIFPIVCNHAMQIPRLYSSCEGECVDPSAVDWDKDLFDLLPGTVMLRLNVRIMRGRG